MNYRLLQQKNILSSTVFLVEIGKVSISRYLTQTKFQETPCELQDPQNAIKKAMRSLHVRRDPLACNEITQENIAQAKMLIEQYNLYTQSFEKALETIRS